MLGGREGGGGGAGGDRPARAPRQDYGNQGGGLRRPAPAPASQPAPMDDFADDDIPF